MLNLVLALGYYVAGFFFALLAASCIGFAISALIALARMFSSKSNLPLAVLYGVGAAVCYFVIIGGLTLAGWIGDRTDYSMQTFLVIGAICPGLGAFSIIPRYIGVAATQTAGGNPFAPISEAATPSTEQRKVI